MADVALSKGQHDIAIKHYETTFRLHQRIFDEDGQIQDLIAQSRCLAAVGQYDEALIRLQRASLIEKTPDVISAIAHVHRLSGIQALAQAKVSLGSKLYDKALSQAETALRSLKLGDGAPHQSASGHRVAALALAQLQEDELAATHLANAQRLEGRTPANGVVAAKLSKLAVKHKQSRELAWKREKAKEMAALAKARRNRPVASKAPPEMSHAEREQMNRRIYPKYYAVQEARGNPYPNPPAPYQQAGIPSYGEIPEPRIPNFQISTAPSYPTYRPPVSTIDLPQAAQQPSVSIPSLPGYQSVTPNFR